MARAMLLGMLASTGCTILPVQTGSSTTPSSEAEVRTSGPEANNKVEPEPIVMPISEIPVDPWIGVSGDKPVTFDDHVEFGKRWQVRTQQIQCTAMRDHCLPPIAWMWIHEGDLSPVKDAHVIAFTPEGASSPHYAKAHINRDPFTAYRTVPATRGNLVAGALAAAHPKAIPGDPVEAFGLWGFGTVERVDWDLGFVWFAGSKEPRFITASRVAVMSYVPGGAVTILGGKQRDQLAVAPAEVVMP